MMRDQARLDRLAQVAVWYYEDKLEQSEIARRIERSVSMVSRMLSEAHQAGLIEIRIKFALRTNDALAQRLVTRFGLKQAHVLDDSADEGDEVDHGEHDDALALRKLAELGARCLRTFLRDGMTLGVAWGRTLNAVVNALAPVTLRDVTVVQLMGALGSKAPLTSGSQLGYRLAEKLGATYHFMHAPLRVETPDTAKSLMRDKEIRRVLNMARKADVVMVAIGGIKPTQTVAVAAGYLTGQDLAHLARATAVGDILNRYLDPAGNEINHTLNRRTIALDLASLKKIPIVIGIAAGQDRAPSICAALRGGYVKVLVTNASTAERTLALGGER